jgi:hypothetical protein
LFSFVKHRSRRKATTWLLAAMQLHLLLVLVLHHHCLPQIALEVSTTPTEIGQTNRRSQPVNGEQSYCTACQILRHGAVRPALGNPTARHSLAAPFLGQRGVIATFSTQPAAWHGRAPPLA